MNNKNTKLNTEETIIKGLKLNIENKGVNARIKPPKKRVQGPSLKMDEKDKIFYNKHMVSDKLQNLVAQGYTKTNRAEDEPQFERMFRFDDVKSRWEKLGKGDKM